MKVRPQAENAILGLMLAIVMAAAIILLLVGLREVFHFAQQISVDEIKGSFPRR